MPIDSRPPVPWATWVLRVASALLLLATLAQGLLAGLFVTGDVDLLAVHSAVGSTLGVVALIQLTAALLERRARGRSGRPGTWRPVILCGILLTLIGAQIGLGMARVVAPHMFIGVTTAAFAMLVLLVVLTEPSPTPTLAPAPAAAAAEPTAAARYTEEIR